MRVTFNKVDGYLGVIHTDRKQRTNRQICSTENYATATLKRLWKKNTSKYIRHLTNGKIYIYSFDSHNINAMDLQDLTYL